MSDLRITVTETASPAGFAGLELGLEEHAAAFVNEAGFKPLAIIAHDGNGNLLGGAAGKINWNWLHVSRCWVAESVRRAGLGSMLLKRIEAEARDRGCRQAHLETFTYQALPFYERHGYSRFATLEDYPPGHSRVYLRKSL